MFEKLSRVDLKFGWLALIVLVIAFVATDFHRELSWDEAVYYSQVRSDVPKTSWHPTRSLGIVALAMPCGVGKCDVPTLRLFMFVLHVLIFAATLYIWKQLTESTCTILVLLGGAHWFSIYFSGELSNNFTFALAALCAVGQLCLYRRDKLDRHLFLFGFALMCAVALRIVDGFVLTITLLGYLFVQLIANRNQLSFQVRCMVILCVAAALGATPFVVESIIKFGDPFSRLLGTTSAAKPYEEFIPLLVRFAQTIDGPTFPGATDPWKYTTIVNLIAYLGVAVASLVVVISKQRKDYQVLLFAIALSSLALYLFMVKFPVPRYLILSYFSFILCSAPLLLELTNKLIKSTWMSLVGVAIAFAFVLVNLIMVGANQSKSESISDALTKMIGSYNLHPKSQIYAEFGAPIYQFHIKSLVTRLDRSKLQDCKYTGAELYIFHHNPIDIGAVCKEYDLIDRRHLSTLNLIVLRKRGM